MNKELAKRLNAYIESEVTRQGGYYYNKKEDLLKFMKDRMNSYPIIRLEHEYGKYNYYHLTQSQQLEIFLAWELDRNEGFMFNNYYYAPDGLGSGVPRYKKMVHHTLPNDIAETNFQDSWGQKAIPDFWDEFIETHKKE